VELALIKENKGVIDSSNLGRAGRTLWAGRKVTDTAAETSETSFDGGNGRSSRSVIQRTGNLISGYILKKGDKDLVAPARIELAFRPCIATSADGALCPSVHNLLRSLARGFRCVQWKGHKESERLDTVETLSLCFVKRLFWTSRRSFFGWNRAPARWLWVPFFR